MSACDSSGSGALKCYFGCDPYWNSEQESNLVVGFDSESKVEHGIQCSTRNSCISSFSYEFNPNIF